MKNIVDKNNQKKVILIITVVVSVVSLLLLGGIFYLVSSKKMILLQSVRHLTNNNKEVVVKNNNNYIEKILDEDVVKNIMNEYNLTFPYVSLLDEMEIKDYEDVTDIFYRVLKDELDDEDILKSKDKIYLTEKDKKVTKLSYLITSDTISDILSDVIEEILENKSLLASLAKTYNISLNEFISNLNSYERELERLNYVSFYYNIYYYGFNNIVLYETELSSYIFQLYNYSDEQKIVLLEDNKIIYTLKVKN